MAFSVFSRLEHLGFDVQPSTTPLTLNMNFWSNRWSSLFFMHENQGRKIVLPSLKLFVSYHCVAIRRTLKKSGVFEAVWRPMGGVATGIVKRLRTDTLFWIL